MKAFLGGILAQFRPFWGYFGVDVGVIPIPGHPLVLLPRPLLRWHILICFWPIQTLLVSKRSKTATKWPTNMCSRTPVGPRAQPETTHFGPTFHPFLVPNGPPLRLLETYGQTRPNRPQNV